MMTWHKTSSSDVAAQGVELIDLSTWSHVWHNFGNLREPEVKRMIYVSLTQTQRDELTSLSHQAIGRVALRAETGPALRPRFHRPLDCGGSCLWARCRAHLAAPL
jgi:hypothetical protein